MSSILVIGGSGYVGSSLVPALVERGHDVQVVDLLWFGRNTPECAPLFRIDAFNLQENDLRGFENVVFLAGLSNDPMADYSPRKNFVFNGALPAYLAYVAKRAGVRRFVYASSCSIYGYAKNGDVFDEDSKTSASYPYGISKLQGEDTCLRLADGNFSAIALRKGTVCGFSPRMRLDLVINTMFRDAVTKGEITVNNANIWRPILSIQDAVRAYILALEAPLAVSGSVNVLSRNYTIGELGQIVQREVKRLLACSVDVTVKNIADNRNYRVSGERARSLIGFHPRDTAETIVADLAEHMDKFSDFGSQRYYNIEVFRAVEKELPIG